MLVGSLREVIAKQATEIELLLYKLNELTASSVKVTSTAVAAVSQSGANFDEVSYLFPLSAKYMNDLVNVGARGVKC